MSNKEGCESFRSTIQKVIIEKLQKWACPTGKRVPFHEKEIYYLISELLGDDQPV